MELNIFNFNDFEIRTVHINEEVWFVGNQVCNALGIKNSSDVISRLDKDEKLLSVLPIAGQSRSVNLIWRYK